jgi:hypothetical protein
MTTVLPKLKFKILCYTPFVWAFEYFDKRRRACGFLLNSCRNILDIILLFRSRYFFSWIDSEQNNFFYYDVLQGFSTGYLFFIVKLFFADSVKIFRQQHAKVQQ